MRVNEVTIILGVVSVPLIILYPLMKRVTWWPQAFLGLTFNFGALMGWSAVMGSIGAAALWLYIGGILWTLGYDTIYAHQDKEDDALAGIKSTAIKFGARSRVWVYGFYGAAFVCLLMAVWLSGGWLALALLALPLVYGAYMLIDRKSTRLNSSHDQISYAVFCLKKKNKTHSTASQAQLK